MLKKIIKKTLFYDLLIKYRQFRSKKEIIKTFANYKYSHSQVHDSIIEYAKKCEIRNFIETGTYAGNTLYAVKDYFDNLYSIELNGLIYKLATEKFKNEAKINILHGESDEVLKKLLPTIDGRAVFWLDAHYSSGGTSKGKKHTPIFEELAVIFSHNIKNHIILIDDMKDFNGADDYPTVLELEAFVLQNSNYSFYIKDGVAHLLPSKGVDL